jgi:hypothetical protein
MRRFFSAAAGLSNHNSGFASSPSAFNGKPLMLVLKRSSNSKHTRNGHDLVRQWSDSFADSVVQILQAHLDLLNQHRQGILALNFSTGSK